MKNLLFLYLLGFASDLSAHEVFSSGGNTKTVAGQELSWTIVILKNYSEEIYFLKLFSNKNQPLQNFKTMKRS